MQHFSRVLAVIDFSGPAYRAFEYALALSRRDGAELAVIHVVPPSEPFDARAFQRRALFGDLRQTATSAGVAIAEVVAQGDAADVIVAQAVSRRAGLIVMGTAQHNAGRFRRASVEERVALKATVPILVVPRRRHTAAVEPFRNIAVAVNFSAGADRMIETAAGLTSGPDDRLTVLHVVRRPASDRPTDAYSVGIVTYQDLLMRDDQEQLVEAAGRRLRSAARAAEKGPAAVATRLLVGNITAEIDRAVDDMGADLLVVGVPKRGLVSRLLFGSPTTGLFNVTGVPLLVVPDAAKRGPAQERTRLKAAA